MRTGSPGKIGILLIIILGLHAKVSMGNTIDSLIQLLAAQKADSDRYNLSVRIAIAYTDSAYDKSLDYWSKALHYAERMGHKARLAHAYHQMGYMYQRKGEFPLALEYFSKAFDTHLSAGNRKGVGQLYNDIGLIYKTWGKLDRAQENFVNALKIFDEIYDIEGIAMASNNIGQIFFYRENYTKAIEYFTKYLEVNQKIGYARAVAGASNNIASAYMALNKYPEALRFYIRAMSIYDSLGVAIGVAIIKDNIGSLYLEMGQPTDALLFHTNALGIFRELGSKQRMCYSLKSIGTTYVKLGQDVKAGSYAAQSLSLAKSLGLKDAERDCYELLAEICSRQKVYDQAFEYLKKSIHIKDSLLNIETMERIERLQTEYETDKRDKDMAIIRDKLKTQKAVITIFWLVGVIVVFLITLLLRENRNKRKYIKQMQANMSNWHEEHKKI